MHLTIRYPYNLNFSYEALEGLQKFSINNLGDPFIESNYGVHSREFEVRPCLQPEPGFEISLGGHCFSTLCHCFCPAPAAADRRPAVVCQALGD